jgi:hypothetical protein
VEHDVVVGAGATGFGVEVAGGEGGAVVGHEKAAGHAEMHQEHLARAELGEKVLCPAGEGRHLLALQPLGESLGEGEAEIGAAQLHPRDALADDGGGEPPADCLDFGQFRHGFTIPVGSRSFPARARHHVAAPLRFRYETRQKDSRARTR